MKKILLFSVFCVGMLTSCNTFWQGVAQGMGNYGGNGFGGYGGNGMGGTTLTGGYYIGPVYCPPLNTQAIEQQSQIVIQQATHDAVENAKQMQRAKEQIEAQAEYNVKHGITTVVVDNSSTSSSSSSSYSSGNSINSSSSSSSCRSCYGTGKCQTCYGNGWYDNPLLSGGKVVCPNCPNHNGRCSKCGGTGRL